MTLSFEDAEQLKLAGFLSYEIEQFASAVDASGKDQPPIDLSGAPWQAMMRSRRDWCDDKTARDWTDEEIEEQIMDYYARNESRSPWDFLKAEYKPPKRVDYIEAARRRAQRRITAGLGRY